MARIEYTATHDGQQLYIHSIELGLLGIRLKQGAFSVPGDALDSTSCPRLQDATAAATRLGFNLSQSWEDCGDGRRITKAWPVS